ncbi:MAG: N-acetyltransferase family protein [Bdellovibrionota bacterium]
MSRSLTIRPVVSEDFVQWLPLWNGYNKFYERVGDTALPPAVTESTWARFLDPREPVFALVAEKEGRLLGLAHFLYHRSTSKIENVCYLSDIFTTAGARGQGVGRALIAGVGDQARKAGASRVYWQTHETNLTAMKLYDQVAERSGFLVYRQVL